MRVRVLVVSTFWSGRKLGSSGRYQRPRRKKRERFFILIVGELKLRTMKPQNQMRTAAENTGFLITSWERLPIVRRTLCALVMSSLRAPPAAQSYGFRTTDSVLRIP